MMDAVVARLHHALVQALRARGDEALERPVTVAEIYQDLVPYRAIRGAVGSELNADYEHALLRLLAGEGGRVRIEPESAREELLQELSSPNPNVGLYRKYAACDVKVSVPADAPPPPPASPARAADGDDLTSMLRDGGGAVGATSAPAPATDPAASTDRRSGVTTPPMERRPGSAARPTLTAGSAARVCVFCRERLPARASVRFCPFCGLDQHRLPCTRCGAALEPEWRFCVDCGSPAPMPEPARTP